MHPWCLALLDIKLLNDLAFTFSNTSLLSIIMPEILYLCHLENLLTTINRTWAYR